MPVLFLSGAAEAFPHRVTIPHGKWSPMPKSRRMMFHEGIEPFQEWLKSEAAVGNFDYVSNINGVHLCFSDENTAFAFKMRFG